MAPAFNLFASETSIGSSSLYISSISSLSDDFGPGMLEFFKGVLFTGSTLFSSFLSSFDSGLVVQGLDEEAIDGLEVVAVDGYFMPVLAGDGFGASFVKSTLLEETATDGFFNPKAPDGREGVANLLSFSPLADLASLLV